MTVLGCKGSLRSGDSLMFRGIWVPPNTEEARFVITESEEGNGFNDKCQARKDELIFNLTFSERYCASKALGQSHPFRLCLFHSVDLLDISVGLFFSSKPRFDIRDIIRRT